MNHLYLLIACFCLGACSSAPTFPDQYRVNGVLYLPYAEIAEPYTAYFDAKSQKSRINYYNDYMQTYQLASEGGNGISKKVAYLSNNKVQNQRVCFQVNGTSSAPVSIQSVLPDLKDFKYYTHEKCPSKSWSSSECHVFRQVVMIGKKKNTYTMWLHMGSNRTTPIRYEMIGYDSLFGSHYDRYYMTYENYTPGKFDQSHFDVDKNLTCGGFPGPGLEAVHLHNPMREFVDRHENHIDNGFTDFKTKHNKVYEHALKETLKKNTFRNNFRYIHSMNRQKRTFTLAVNHLADMNNEELKLMRGRLPSNGNKGAKVFTDTLNLKEMPESIDWRLFGAVNPVKDQAVCGSCWSFGTTGVLEGAIFMKTGKLVKLSQQQLMDCSWGQGNNACDGGEDFRAYTYIMQNGGLESEETYGRYLGADGKCHHNASKSVLQIDSFVNVTSGNLTALKIAMLKRGPISVGIDAAVKSFSFYANGVYYDPACGNKLSDLDHAVLAVGYGKMNGESYWLVKNSWSTNWGNDGYVLISQKDNNCGVATQPTFPILK